ncbi:Uncharacterized protein Fot_48809 [Forsythia ovata]|uniref:Uncharacterized protein n=1 Tax=Forsythia ovata TaxID=205694 RepID=A0ABD1QA36_9LAMI
MLDEGIVILRVIYSLNKLERIFEYIPETRTTGECRFSTDQELDPEDLAATRNWKSALISNLLQFQLKAPGFGRSWVVVFAPDVGGRERGAVGIAAERMRLGMGLWCAGMERVWDLRNERINKRSGYNKLNIRIEPRRHMVIDQFNEPSITTVHRDYSFSIAT